MMIKLLFSRKYILLTVLITVLCLLFLRLAAWQWQRHHIQLADDAAYLAQLQQAPIALNAISDSASLLTMTDRAVEATGQFDYAEQRVLKNQISELGQGVHLIVPFVLAGGEQAVLVDRGWVEVSADVAQLDEPLTRVVGRIRQSDRPLDAVPDQELFRVAIADLQQQIPYDLLPIIITQTPLETDTATTRPLRPAFSVIGSYNGNSLGYTVQWLAFALIFGVGYLFYLRRAVQ